MKILNKFGYSKIEVLVVVFLLGVVSFITINKTSYAFEVDSKQHTNEIISLIEIQAKDYAEDHLEIFRETDATFITVGDLVDSDYLYGNSKGLVIDPSDSSKYYNDDKVKLEYNAEKNEVKATYVA